MHDYKKLIKQLTQFGALLITLFLISLIPDQNSNSTLIKIISCPLSLILSTYAGRLIAGEFRTPGNLLRTDEIEKLFP